MPQKNIQEKIQSLSALKLKVKQPSSPAEARKWLKATAADLSTVPNASHPLLFVAHGINEFLKGKGKISLDVAFGVTPKRGAPRKLSKVKTRLTLARKIFALRLAGKTWDDIAEKLENQGYQNIDTRSLRRTYEEFKVQLLAKELGAQGVLPDEKRSIFPKPSLRSSKPPSKK